MQVWTGSKTYPDQITPFFNLCIPSISFIKDLNHFFHFPEAKPEVAMAMLRWAYTDDLELNGDDGFLIDLMKLANRFQLQLLRER